MASLVLVFQYILALLHLSLRHQLQRGVCRPEYSAVGVGVFCVGLDAALIKYQSYWPSRSVYVVDRNRTHIGAQDSFDRLFSPTVPLTCVTLLLLSLHLPSVGP